jgi:hypothetical protein
MNVVGLVFESRQGNKSDLFWKDGSLQDKTLARISRPSVVGYIQLIILVSIRMETGQIK